MPYTRAHIRFDTVKEANEFVRTLNTDGTTDKYILESFDGSHRIDARSLFGVMYMFAEHNDDIYLVNVSTQGTLPMFVDKFRVESD